MSESPRTLTVTGQGSAQTAPDHFTINIGIESSQPTVREAYAQAGAAVNAVTAVLLAQGVEQSSVSSSSLDVRVETRWQEGTGNVVTGYTVSTTLAVPLDYGKDAEETIAAVVESGNNNVRLNGLTPVVTDSSPAQHAARTGAWAQARRAAELYADLAGCTLGDVVNVEEIATPMGGPRPMMARAMSTSADSLAMPIMTGQSDVMIDVKVTWQLS